MRRRVDGREDGGDGAEGHQAEDEGSFLHEDEGQQEERDGAEGLERDSHERNVDRCVGSGEWGVRTPARAVRDAVIRTPHSPPRTE